MLCSRLHDPTLSRSDAQAARHGYLVPHVDAGTSADPFRPHGADQPGWAAIDLHPDSSRLAGQALLALPARDDAPARAYLDNDLDGPSVAVRTAIGTRLALTPQATTLRAMVVLTQHSREDGTRWKPLRPTVSGLSS